MKSGAYWLESVNGAKFPCLSRDLNVEVVVVGAGLTGITAAYLMKKAGRKVALVSRGCCAQAESGHTTAHLTCVTDKRLHNLVSEFGKDAAKAAWEAGFAAIDQIAANIKDEAIKCDFKWIPGYLFGSLKEETKNDLEALKQDAELAEQFGFPAKWLDSIPYFNRPGICFAN